MKSYDSELIDDVEELLEKVILAEVTTAVWNTFQQALSQLDPESLEILESHLNGATHTELSKEKKISEQDIEKWLRQIKRQLQRSVRKDLQVRQ